MRGFKAFLLRGNVVDLAVGVVIGVAFTAVVTGFTGSFITPLIAALSARQVTAVITHPERHDGLVRRPQMLAQWVRQGAVAQVVREVEMRVVHPDRAAEAEGDEADFLAVPRDEAQLAVDHLLEILERRGRAFEDAHTPDVHRIHRPLDMEERGVHRAHPVHRSPSSSRTRASTRYACMFTDMPQWLDSISTCSAQGSRHACQATIPSLRE